MQRLQFIKTLGLAAAAMTLSDLKNLAGTFSASPRMPALFMGHGSPMNAIEDNEFSRSWKKLGSELPRPKAILCISAHWLTKGVKVLGSEKPRTIYDFGGFPDELFRVTYPAPGSPETAREVQQMITGVPVEWDTEWGLDHGTWSLLVRMFPNADVPVFQMSIDYSKPHRWHYELGKQLAALRDKGVLIVGSGNIIHNLYLAKFEKDPKPYDWAVEFDAVSKKLILDGNHNALIEYEKLGKAAQLSIPTPDHYWPLLYILGLQSPSDTLSFPVEGLAFGSGNMTSVMLA